MKNVKNILLIGAPGSGKGTLSKELKGFYQLSTGDMLRSEINKGSDLGKFVANLIDNGNFVSDEIMYEIIQKNIPVNEKLIFDGYPRNKTQIKYFEKMILDKNDVYVIYFDINKELLENRILNRKTCKDCGEIHNNSFNKPNNGRCNKCNGDLIIRKDDNSATLRKRLDTFYNETYPMIEHFQKYKNFLQINADQHPDSILKDVMNFLVN